MNPAGIFFFRTCFRLQWKRIQHSHRTIVTIHKGYLQSILSFTSSMHCMWHSERKERSVFPPISLACCTNSSQCFFLFKPFKASFVVTFVSILVKSEANIGHYKSTHTFISTSLSGHSIVAIVSTSLSGHSTVAIVSILVERKRYELEEYFVVYTPSPSSLFSVPSTDPELLVASFVAIL